MAANAFVRALLAGPAWLYELAVRVRTVAYETNYLKSRKLDTAVVSVGNITVGGTGKTPLVEYIARYLTSEGYSIAILTRGYGRHSRGQKLLNAPSGAGAHQGKDPSPARTGDVVTIDDSLARGFHGTPSYLEFGDEPVMLSRALPEVPIVVNANRFEGGRWAEQNLHPDVIILDDAYQHLALARDVNVLVLDATDPFGGERMIPFGRLREPLFGIKRADAIIVTRAHRPFDQGRLLSVLRYFLGDKVPVMYAHSSIVRLRHLETQQSYDAQEFRGWNAAVMCGIGNPSAFSDDLIQIGVNIATEEFFRDHRVFTHKDLEKVVESASKAGADMIVTTEKDAVRLANLKHGEVPIYVAEMEIESEDEVRLKSFLLRSLLVKRNENQY